MKVTDWVINPDGSLTIEVNATAVKIYKMHAAVHYKEIPVRVSAPMAKTGMVVYDQTKMILISSDGWTFTGKHHDTLDLSDSNDRHLRFDLHS